MGRSDFENQGTGLELVPTVDFQGTLISHFVAHLIDAADADKVCDEVPPPPQVTGPSEGRYCRYWAMMGMSFACGHRSMILFSGWAKNG